MMENSIFDVPPIKPSERKAYKKFCKKMNELGYTEKLAGFMRSIMLEEKFDEREFYELLSRVRLEEMGIDTSKML
jgi:CRISPR/Cas system-associated protein endoribonuclease Cas2